MVQFLTAAVAVELLYDAGKKESRQAERSVESAGARSSANCDL
jgi:hypothetical protein